MRRIAAVSALSLAIAGLLPLAAQAAGKYSWFDDVSARDALGLPRTPAALQPDAPVRFDVNAYQSLAASRALEDDGDVVQFYGQLQPLPGALHVPLAAINRDTGAEPLESQRDTRLSGFGIRWEHRVNAENTLALAAGYNESATNARQYSGAGVLDTRAALSWSNTWAGEFNPGITSSVFFGDESGRDDSYQRLGRRYFGFTIGGQLTLARDHTPYLSYSLRRNLYDDTVSPAYFLSPYDDRALVSAGWRWQAQPNLSFQAEASYGLADQTTDPNLPLERSRFFFGTRFDFR